MVTTIKVSDATKAELERLKEGRESFDTVLNRLMDHVEREHLEQELIEGYSSMTDTHLDESEEWELL